MRKRDDERPPDSDRTDSSGRGPRTQKEQLRMIQCDLSEAYRRLEELENAKAQFVLTLTHELRSPVAAIQSLLKAMPFTGDLPEKAKDLLRRADERATALLNLVNDLLDVAKERHEFGAKKFHPVGLGAALRSVRTAYQGQAEVRGVDLAFEGLETDVRSPGDPEELERLFGNLVDNAIKYTPPGGIVKVTVRKAKEVGGRGNGRTGESPIPGWVEVEVADTGIGIPAGSLRRLFEEFYRAPNARRALAHGTGLGLTLCKRIAEEHGGRIDVESRENAGSIFTVRLPLAPDQGSA